MRENVPPGTFDVLLHSARDRSQRHAPSSLRAQDWHDALPCCCRYVESFDQATMLEMTQVVSAEGAALVEAQTGALFGDLKALQRQMQASEVLMLILAYTSVQLC